jgi:putative membrane protein
MKGRRVKGLAIRWLIQTVAILAAGHLINGIRVEGIFSAFGAAAILGILNAFFRPVLLLLTLPLTLLTLGLFTFVINGLMLMMASGVIPGFKIVGFWSAVGGALVISLVSWLLNVLISDKGTIDVIEMTHKGGNRWE